MRESIFLTGATGLIGGEILRLLLDAPGDRLFSLVRARNSIEAELRLLERLGRSGVTGSQVPVGRMVALAGDLTADGLGLASDDQQDPLSSVGTIIHCAAETSFIRDENCHRINVGGMRQVIEFARRCRHTPTIVHVSTATVCGAMRDCCVDEDFECSPDNDHFNEYTRSKAIAEKMLRDSGLPFVIVRPSITVSAGIQSQCFANAMLWWLPLLSQFDAVPIHPDARVDVVTVSFVAQSIIGVMNAADRRHDCYNISAGRDDSLVLGQAAVAVDAFYDRPEPLRLVPFAEWTRELHRTYVRTPQQRKTFAALRHYLPFLNMNVTYDNTRLGRLLGPDLPVLDPFESYVASVLELMSPELMPK